MSGIFDYQINIDFQKVGKSLQEKIGNSWAVVERFLFPESFVSNKGAFMFKVREDEKNFIDTWLLVIPSDIKVLFEFLKEKITYGDFLFAEGNKFFILKWDLQKFRIYAERELNLSEVKEYVTYISDQTVLPESKENINKIVNILKEIEIKNLIDVFITSSVYYKPLDSIFYEVFQEAECRFYMNFSDSSFISFLFFGEKITKDKTLDTIDFSYSYSLAA